MIIYNIRPGDTIYGVSKKFGVSQSVVLEINDITDERNLTIGQSIIIPNGKATKQTIIKDYILVPTNANNKKSIDVNGYVFPEIDMELLNKTLPNLSFLSIFSYQVKPDGSLVEIDDQPLIDAAMAKKVAPIMVISNILEGGSFDSNLVQTILNNSEIQDKLISNILTTLKSKNYYGVDVDFEYIFPKDKNAYNNFLKKLSDTLKPLNYSISTALAPKTSATQRGLLYEAHDYKFIGNIVDRIILMTYEWGYTFGPAQAVSPIDKVEEVLKYAVNDIDSQKILMGMPNYGYDWTLPFVEGSRAMSLSNSEAISLAQKVGSIIEFDQTTQTPFFTYYDTNNKRHIVWFDDVRSINSKLKLVEKYNLGGVSYWTINKYYAQNWIVLNYMYNINKYI